MQPDRYSKSRYTASVSARSEIPRHNWIDIRTPEAHTESSIEGSSNFCIYEVTFDKEIQAHFPETTTPIIVYGQSSAFFAADVAARRLEDLGYTNVAVLEGGLAAWNEASQTSEVSNAQSSDSNSERLAVDLEKSTVRWFGRNLLNQHNGTIGIQTGNAECIDGVLTGGKLTLDMTALSCEDIEDPSLSSQLIQHLSHSDFLLVEKYP